MVLRFSVKVDKFLRLTGMNPATISLTVNEPLHTLDLINSASGTQLSKDFSHPILNEIGNGFTSPVDDPRSMSELQGDAAVPVEPHWKCHCCVSSVSSILCLPIPCGQYTDTPATNANAHAGAAVVSVSGSESSIATPTATGTNRVTKKLTSFLFRNISFENQD